MKGNYISCPPGYCDPIYSKNIFPRSRLGKPCLTFSNNLCSLIVVSKGGSMSFDATEFDAFSAALVKFSSEVTDPKAAIIGSFASALGIVNTDLLRYSDCVINGTSMDTNSPALRFCCSTTGQNLPEAFSTISSQLILPAQT